MTLDDIKARCVEEGLCWLYGGKRRPYMTINGVHGINVRRLVFGLAGKKFYAGGCILPACGVINCVSPDCLFQTTRSHVLKRSHERGARVTSLKGLVATAKKKRTFTDQQISGIRESDGTLGELVKQWGGSKSSIGQIRRGDSYKPQGVSVFSWRPA